MAMNQFRQSEVSQWIKDYNEAVHLDRMQTAFEQTAEGKRKIAERKEKENEKVRQLAEKVYNHYLPQGEALATQRKELYLQQNLKR